jgi:hypothetical protein
MRYFAVQVEDVRSDSGVVTQVYNVYVAGASGGNFHAIEANVKVVYGTYRSREACPSVARLENNA